MKLILFAVLLALAILAQTTPILNQLDLDNSNTDTDTMTEGQVDVMEGKYFEGDMRLSDEEIQERLYDRVQPTQKKNQMWLDRTVFYTIVGFFTPKQKKMITDGINLITSTTCIKIKKHALEKDYVEIQNGTLIEQGCNSPVGRQGGKQIIYLSYDCISAGGVAHEFIHALGFDHEQTRYDRDDYVTYIEANVNNTKKHGHNFNKYAKKKAELYDLPYDYESIMHYGRHAFAKKFKNGTLKDTLIPKQDVEIGLRKKLSDYNIQMIGMRYKCKPKK